MTGDKLFCDELVSISCSLFKNWVYATEKQENAQIFLVSQCIPELRTKQAAIHDEIKQLCGDRDRISVNSLLNAFAGYIKHKMAHFHLSSIQTFITQVSTASFKMNSNARALVVANKKLFARRVMIYWSRLMAYINYHFHADKEQCCMSLDFENNTIIHKEVECEDILHLCNVTDEASHHNVSQQRDDQNDLCLSSPLSQHSLHSETPSECYIGSPSSSYASLHAVHTNALILDKICLALRLIYEIKQFSRQSTDNSNNSCTQIHALEGDQLNAVMCHLW